MRVLLALLLVSGVAHAQGAAPPVPLIDVPYISQTEALCGGAAAAMVLRYWGERGIDAEAFAHLVDRSAAGIRTDALTAGIATRGWQATPAAGSEPLARDELAQGRPVLALIEDRPGAFHYVVVVAWHDRGVVFHDPARAPFRVMPRDAFLQRWRAADSWMLVVLPRPGATRPDAPAATAAPATACDQAVAAGVQAAQANDLPAAERTLAGALACGGAAARELAAVRLLQRRWPEVGELAAAALAADPHDAYAWKLLATSRFVQDDRRGALAAWNEVGEPAVDLVRIDGLTRTRHRVVERLIGAPTGGTLTPDGFTRARRRLFELPTALSARLEFVPVAGGLTELRGAVDERPVAPASAIAVAGIGVSALATREVAVTFGSLTGGGEALTAAWRFWERRPRIAVGVRAPAPWGGTWGVDAEGERQPLDTPALPVPERRTARVTVANWATGAVRWDAGVGLEQRDGLGRLGLGHGGVTLATPGDRVDVTLGATQWFGAGSFTTAALSLAARSRLERRGAVVVGAAALHGATRSAPLDLWAAGDTGHVRPTLLRAHPLLDDGRLQAARLGRLLLQASLEAQRWWAPLPAVRVAAALFLDAARTAARRQLPPIHDADAGAGARLAVAGIPGVFQIDVARGLRDGAAALSLSYRR